MRCKHGPVVALMGFADRKAVALARSKGAFACLELPLNLDDLIDVIDRFSRIAATESRPRPAGSNPPISSPRASAPRRG